MNDLIRSYAKNLNDAYGGMLKIDDSSLEGISVDGNIFEAPEVRASKVCEAAYDKIFSDPANSRLQCEIARRVDKIAKAGYKTALPAAEDIGVTPRDRTVRIMFGAAGGNGACYDNSNDTIFITVPFAMREGNVPAKAMAEEYIHAFTNQAAPELMKRCKGSAKRVDLFESPANFIVEGIGQMYARYVKHVNNKELVKAVKNGNTAAIERLRNDPYHLGYIIMDTMSRAWGRKEAVKEALGIGSAEVLLARYTKACEELGEPAVNFMKGAGKLIFDSEDECP